MISDLVVFGATGDLAGRFLLPALAKLLENGKLPPDFTVIGAAQRDGDDEVFREHAAARLRTHAPDLPPPVIEELLQSLRYRPVDVTDPASVGAALGRLRSDTASGQSRPVAVYLALPVQVVPAAIATLKSVNLPSGSRIVVEKPFGEDLDGAVALNALLAEVTARPEPVDVFRVDHVLGMETLSNLLAVRFANRVMRSVWDSAHIEQVEILWEESLALEGRAGYFDRAGMLKDVLQNHMMQVLSLVAMEEPATREQLRDHKVEVLRAVRPLTPADVVERTARGRYTAGRLTDDADGGGRNVASYVDEDGVDPERSTETFGEVTLEIDTPRWTGTRFVLRAGKALSQRRKGVLLRFRHVDDGGFLHGLGNDGGQLWIGVDGPNDVTLELSGMTSLEPLEPSPLALTSPPRPSRLPAYSHVLLDILRGGNSLSVRGDEAEEAWRVVEPVLDAWHGGLVPLQDYPAGSLGPSAAHGVTLSTP